MKIEKLIKEIITSFEEMGFKSVSYYEDSSKHVLNKHVCSNSYFEINIIYYSKRILISMVDKENLYASYLDIYYIDNYYVSTPAKVSNSAMNILFIKEILKPTRKFLIKKKKKEKKKEGYKIKCPYLPYDKSLKTKANLNEEFDRKEKYVYITYDPLYEKVICVHEKPNMYCDICAPIFKDREMNHPLYMLEEQEFKVKTKLKADY